MNSAVFKRNMRWAHLSWALIGALSACPPRPPGEVDSGMPVVDGGCSGVIGCECSAGSCQTGECINNQCVDCRRGEAACICRTNGSCNAGLRCAANRCETCPAGQMGCACSSGDVCGTGLVCNNGMCVAETCAAGTAGCPCRSGSSRCEPTLYCDGMSLCQNCSNDVVGCPCNSSMMCSGGTVCESSNGLCRAARTCAQLVAAGTCLPHQSCTQTNGADATCVPMMCEANFKWDGTACVACASPGCGNEPMCSDIDGGLGSTCAAQNRSCTQVGSVATCGACLSGYVGPATGPCVRVPSCGAVTCDANSYCDISSGMPTCAALPCPSGQARDGTGQCSVCTNSCSGAGLSGRVWPDKIPSTGVCVCETLDGYFFPANGGTPIPCDADQDGWVREEAGDNAITSVPALRANARCRIRTVSRVRLVDEYGMWVEALSCTNGLVKAALVFPDGGQVATGLNLGRLDSTGALLPLPDGGSLCQGPLPMRLLETLRNDTPGGPSGTGAPPYGGLNGRLLQADELNPLTKACVTTSADYNDNKLEDIAEKQGVVSQTRGAIAADRARLEQFAYFVELYSAFINNDTLVIQERSRVNNDFPLRYDPAVRFDGGVFFVDGGLVDGYSLANDNPYWRACARNRDPTYNQTNLVSGYDFAQWNCDATSLSCPDLAPPAHPSDVGPLDPRVRLMRNFGLGRLGGALPADRKWRGMNHHSQFKCVNVVNGPGTPNSFDRVQGDFGNANGQLTFNQCVARPCAPGTTCATPQGTGLQTRQPIIDCTARAGVGVSGAVGFAAVNYRPYRAGDPSYSAQNYQGGCVNEDDAWWTFLCPFPQFTLIKANADAKFGKYSCYKYGQNFVWAGALPDGGSNATDVSTLRWGANSNGSMLGPHPPPSPGAL